MQKIVVLGDAHIPYHDLVATELVLDVCKEVKPDYVIMLGDMLDCFTVSSFSKDPSKVTRLDHEFAAGNLFLDKLRKMVGSKAQLVYIDGNHEARLSRYITEKARELVGLVSISKGLMLAERKIRHVKYKRYFQLGKIIYTHDLDYTGPYVANRALSSAAHSVVVGHSHRIGYAIEGDIKGCAKVGACFGWLGDVEEIDYAHQLKVKKEWAHGFGVGYMTETGITYLSPVPIINGTCCVDGKLFSI